MRGKGEYMKEQSRLRLLFVLVFTTVIICLGLIAIIVAMSLSLRQWKQENKNLKDKTYILQAEINNLKPNYTQRQDSIIKIVVGNPDISKVIKKQPVLGGNWGVWSEKSIKFLTEDKLLMLYDDGHIMGAMIVKVNNPQNMKTWQVIWNTML
jgi:ABC-type lipoprotein release transport system permease subunit